MDDIKKQRVLLEDFKANKERCPKDGNKIFLTYDSKNGIPSFIKCTYCGSVYDFREGEGGWVLRTSF